MRHLWSNRFARVEKGTHAATSSTHLRLTPSFAKGPLGPKTLCNACGLRHSKKTKKLQEEESLQADGSGEFDSIVPSPPPSSAKAVGKLPEATRYDYPESPESPMFPRLQPLQHESHQHQQVNQQHLLPRLSVPDILLGVPASGGGAYRGNEAPGSSSSQGYQPGPRRMSIQMDGLSIPMNLGGNSNGGGGPSPTSYAQAPTPVSRPHTYYPVPGSVGRPMQPPHPQTQQGYSSSSSSLPSIQTNFNAPSYPSAAGSSSSAGGGSSASAGVPQQYNNSHLYSYGSRPPNGQR